MVVSGRSCALLTVLACILGASGSPAGPLRELTPVDAVETTRILQNQNWPGGALDDNFASPDGRRYLIRTAHGDATRNGVWVDFWSGSLTTLAAAEPRRCAHLFTSGLAPRDDEVGANWDATPANVVRWINGHAIAFLWTDARDVRQVVALDLASCHHHALTHSASSVANFAFGAGHRLLVSVRRPRPPSDAARRWHEGFTLPESASAWSVLQNDPGGAASSAARHQTTWSIRIRGGQRAVDILGEPVDHTDPFLRPLGLSPDGRFAVTHVGRRDMPEAWHAYPDPSIQRMFAVNQDRPGLLPVQLLVIDLMAAASRALWEAPNVLENAIAFAPDSSAVLVAPTFLPAPAAEAGLRGHAAAIVDVRSGRYQVLPVDLTNRIVRRAVWETPSCVAIETSDDTGDDAQLARFRRSADGWELDLTTRDRPAPVPIRLQVRQTLNEPPTVWAVAADGTERLLLDPDRQLRDRFRLGRVERRTGMLPDGHPWRGQLIYPADYRPGARYPLVIQSLYGKNWDPAEFTLDGAWGGHGVGLGPSEYPAYPGQLLASRDIAVLQVELLQSRFGVREAEEHQRLFESLAEELTASGLVDRGKVALTGFSRNGYWVDYTLTHSAFPFAAALTADSYDPGYVTSALNDWWSFDAEVNGGPAFGAGLPNWLAKTPGFNAEQVHTPLRMIGQSIGGIGYLMAKWELYSRLRHLHKPVEIALMPDINDHPSHNPQNPRQVMAIQESSLDWLTFWLTGREDPDPTKRAQYSRWHHLRQLQTSALPPG